ncbi:MAG: GMC oxidoreductase [Bdellovibrionales bacterium]
MHIDGNQLNSGVREADLCIIGAGAAGIAIALELRNSGLKIILLEAGGFEMYQQSQNLYFTQMEDSPKDCLGPEYGQMSRLRLFGGTTGHWGGWTRPLDPHDFYRRNWIPYSGWPIQQEDLVEAYRKASELVEVDAFDFEAENQGDVSKWVGKDLDVDFDGTPIIPRYFNISGTPTRFGKRYRGDIVGASDIELITSANMVQFECGPGFNNDAHHVQSVRIMNYNGQVSLIRAKKFVLACGAIENARLLLNSNDTVPMGLGNQNDLVGRFFMEHPHATLGFFVGTTTRQRLDPYLSPQPPYRGPNQSFRQPVLMTRSEFQARHQVGSFSCQIQGGDAPPEVADQPTIEDVLALCRKRREIEGEPDYLKLYMRSEMEPDPQNRVSLEPEKDQLGLQIAKLTVRFSERDLRNARISTEAVIRVLSALDMGRGQITLEGENIWPRDLFGGFHHMGTTRMADDPSQGVVDRHCKVHGVSNLYVAGSSVFPTAGCANPTLTILALAVRLSQHLKGQRS